MGWDGMGGGTLALLLGHTLTRTCSYVTRTVPALSQSHHPVRLLRIDETHAHADTTALARAAQLALYIYHNASSKERWWCGYPRYGPLRRTVNIKPQVKNTRYRFWTWARSNWRPSSIPAVWVLAQSTTPQTRLSSRCAGIGGLQSGSDERVTTLGSTLSRDLRPSDGN